MAGSRESKPCYKSPKPLPKMKTSRLFAILSLLTLLLPGCASVTTDQTETNDAGYTRHTKFKARTFFDSKNELAKTRTTMTDKTQGVAISGLEQESSGSNVVALTERVVSAAVSAAIKSAAPVP